MSENKGPSIFPIHGLPYDILREVLLTCYLNFVSSNSTNPVHVSVILSQVNRSWRRIVLSTPLLWSSIYIRKELGGPDSLLRRTKACLDRSRNHPLFISIQLRSLLDTQQLSKINYAVNHLVPHSHRWHSMSVHGPLATHLILAQARSHLDSLVNLHSNILLESQGLPKTDRGVWWNAIHAAYEQAPSLKAAYLPTRIAIRLPLGDLETWVGTPAEQQLRDVYLRGQNLLTLILRGFLIPITSVMSFRVPSGINVLPNLTSLSLTVNGPDYGLFCNHVLPPSLNLKRFSLIIQWRGISFTLDPFLKWISRLPPTLSLFSLTGSSDLYPIEAARILYALHQSSITHLRISLPPCHHSDILAEFIGPSSPTELRVENPPIPFPHLEYLDVVQEGWVRPLWMQFFEDRCLKSTTPLRAVYLSYPGLESIQDEETVTVLKTLQEKGLTFKVEPWGLGEDTFMLRELMRKVRWDVELEETLRRSPWTCVL